jgi:class 3 adenylate cyclase/tetratricopeptide (TPR) repeat protein
VTCTSCGATNSPGRRFCGECGSPLSVGCPACGAANEPGVKFCGQCGASLAAVASTAAGVAQVAPQATRSAPTAERKLVSVLFADLVGFTTLSESKDAEEVRDLLTRYFDTARQIITRYGGAIEKFIGDAVMAVWGTPVAQEDDAERAVRAALDLTQAVQAVGADVGAPDLRARAGVMTGEAAVTLGAEGQGMVAGDLVNTASRAQSAAEPGVVLVGDATRRATEAAIAYEDGGSHALKGKAEPVQLWRALRVVAAVGGMMRFAGLEPPFVGRDRELRLVKEMFHASAEERRAHLVSVVGLAGIGKTRLSWEFEKYIDGLARDVWWHRGRCLAYGEGVTYWALAEMVRSRAGIIEDEPPATAREKLRAALPEHIADPDERGWVEPRLAHLLGLEERTTPDQENLFSAWRLFFERLADTNPTVLVFEDLQWADSGLLDFIEYLVDWSRDHPLFVMTLARPELADRRPNWGAGKRNFSSLSLEPLSRGAMTELIAGLVPGLPEELRARVLDRAEGVPLYAVETVRMLIDRGLLISQNGRYALAGPIETLEVPETLHGLIAARLDGLTTEERRLIQDASVLGKAFTKGGLTALGGLLGRDLDALLTSLVRKEVLSVQADPRSPERGQYGFLQELVKRVAYDTMSKKERKGKHLAAARHLESGAEEEGLAGVIASHYLDAYRAAPDAEDAQEIRSSARHMLIRAGDRAASLAGHEEAEDHFTQGAELTDDPTTKAALLERAGEEAYASGNHDVAISRYEGAIDLFEGHGHTHPAARVKARLAFLMWDRGRFAEAVGELEQSFRVLSAEERDADLAWIAQQLGRILYFAGRSEEAIEPLETALDIAEGLWLPEVFAQAMTTKAIVLYSGKERRREGMALLRHALEVALENDLPSAAMRARNNLADLAAQSDRYEEARQHVLDGLAMARRVGNRQQEWTLLGFQLYTFFALGDWDELLHMAGQLPQAALAQTRGPFSHFMLAIPAVHLHRGELDQAEANFAVFPESEASPDVQERIFALAGRASLLRAQGHSAEALAMAEQALELWQELGLSHEGLKEAFVTATEAAFDIGDLHKVEESLRLVDGIEPGRRSRTMYGHALRFRARLAAQREHDDQVEQGYREAAAMFREMATPFWLAQTLLEHSEWLAEHDRQSEGQSLVAEARDIFERLRAKPWLDRTDRLSEEAMAKTAKAGSPT